MHHPVPLKTCNACRECKPENMYGKNRSLKSGINSICKECVSKDNARRHAAKNAWRAANRERSRESNRASVARNPDAVRKSKAKWVKQNAPNVNARTAKRRALKVSALPSWADRSKIAAIYKQARDLTLATGQIWNVDHIVPLRSKYVCGLHCPDNMRVILKSDNTKKGNRHWPDMP